MLPPKIPKLLHVYWSGSLSYLRLLTLVSFRRLHPDFRIQLYTSPSAPMQWGTGEQSVPYMQTSYWTEVERYVDEVQLLSEVAGTPCADLPASRIADLVRLQCLATAGGVWSDMDVLWLKSVEAIDYSHVYPDGDAVDAIAYATVFQHGSTGVVMMAPETAYGTRLYADGIQHVHDAHYQAVGPVAFLRAGNAAKLQETHPGFVFSELAPETFYPIAFDAIPQLFLPPVALPSATVALHWFGGHQLLGDFQNACPTPDAMAAAPVSLLTETLRACGLLDEAGL